MKTERLIAMDLLPYGKKILKKGKEFKASASDANVLVSIGKAARVVRTVSEPTVEMPGASTSPPDVPPQSTQESLPPPAETPPATTQRRRTSRSRASQAEQS